MKAVAMEQAGGVQTMYYECGCYSECDMKLPPEFTKRCKKHKHKGR